MGVSVENGVSTDRFVWNDVYRHIGVEIERIRQKYLIKQVITIVKETPGVIVNNGQYILNLLTDSPGIYRQIVITPATRYPYIITDDNEVSNISRWNGQTCEINTNILTILPRI